MLEHDVIVSSKLVYALCAWSFVEKPLRSTASRPAVLPSSRLEALQHLFRDLLRLAVGLRALKRYSVQAGDAVFDARPQKVPHLRPPLIEAALLQPLVCRKLDTHSDALHARLAAWSPLYIIERDAKHVRDRDL